MMSRHSPRLKTVGMMKGLNPLHLKFELSILVEGNGLAQFLYQPLQGHKHSRTSLLELQYRRYSTTIFNGIKCNKTCISHDLVKCFINIGTIVISH